MIKKNQTTKFKSLTEGFTLIEILIAIIVIGILSTISISYVSSTRDKAIAAAYLTTARTLERGFVAKGISDGITTWWDGSDFEGCAGLYGSSPRIPGMVANCDFSDFIPGDLEDLGLFAYDSSVDADDYVGGCTVAGGSGLDPTKGVNILIKDTVTPDIFDKMDDVIDSGDGPFCGKMRYSESSKDAFYSIDLTRGDAALRF